MAKFRFQLDALLKARSMFEQKHQRAVAAIEKEKRQLEDSLRKLQDTISANKASLHDHLIGRVDAQALRWHAGASMQYMRQAQRAVLELAGIHRRLEAARNQLIEASRKRRAIELLKEKRLQEWRYEQGRLEVNAMDELAVIAAAKVNGNVPPDDAEEL